jgi:hypothetical protein
MNKQGKIKSINKGKEKDQYGNYTFFINLEDDTALYFKQREENQNKFIIGNDINVDVEEIKREGKPSIFKILFPKPAFGGGGGGSFKGLSKDDQIEIEKCRQKSIEKQVIAKITSELIIGKGLPVERFNDIATDILQWFKNND